MGLWQTPQAQRCGQGHVAWMIQSVNPADGSRFPATVFSISGGSSRTAPQALDRTGCCSLSQPGCNRHSSTERRGDVASIRSNKRVECSIIAAVCCKVHFWSTHIEQVNPLHTVQHNSHEYSSIREKHPKAHLRRATQRPLCSEGNCDGCEDPLPKVSATSSIDNK